jgi:hypothetical protein
MATGKELKKVAKARLSSAKVLVKNNDLNGAMLLMGYALECALKSAACKALCLAEFPASKKSKINDHFFTHNHDSLLILSGASDDTFSPSQSSEYYYWSDFTKEYQGDWTSMRYECDPNKTVQEAEQLASHLENIFRVLTRKRKW